MPFGHQLFHQIFPRTAYGIDQPGCFNFVEDLEGNPHSQVTLYTGVTICGWVSNVLQVLI